MEYHHELIVDILQDLAIGRDVCIIGGKLSFYRINK